MLNKYSFAVIIIVFIVSACTHAPTTPELSESAKPDHNAVNTLAQKADFISPPLSDDLKLNDVSENKSSHHQLIWRDLESKFELTKLYDHPHVSKQKNKFLNQTSFLSNSTKRSEPFIHFVLGEIEKRQLPAELAILPIVESGYYPRARSRAKAEGLWQIMPYTAKELGLTRSVGYDGRHDVYEATSAALDYLEQMYARFDGDWLLALAAYNAGPHRVNRALKKVQTIDENVYWDLRLPRETREYVPKLLAICSIIQDRELSSTILYPVENKSYLSNIELSKRISPEKLIKAAAVSESEIKMLNPALRNLSTPVPAGYQLLVPKRDTELLTLAIRNMPEAPQPTWAKHKINRGESLGGIARRYGTSINALREANNMHGNKIVAGRSLIVPLRNTNRGQSVAKHKQKATLPITETNTVIKEPVIDAPYVYVVAMGDSYWKIANRNNTTVKRLYEINGRNADQPLKPGETLLVD